MSEYIILRFLFETLGKISFYNENFYKIEQQYEIYRNFSKTGKLKREDIETKTYKQKEREKKKKAKAKRISEWKREALKIIWMK